MEGENIHKIKSEELKLPFWLEVLGVFVAAS